MIPAYSDMKKYYGPALFSPFKSASDEYAEYDVSSDENLRMLINEQNNEFVIRSADC